MGKVLLLSDSFGERPRLLPLGVQDLPGEDEGQVLDPFVNLVLRGPFDIKKGLTVINFENLMVVG